MDAQGGDGEMTTMTPARAVWLCWCGFWAIAWLLVGFFSFGIGWLGIPFSLLAMLLVLIPSPQRQQVQGPPQIRVLPPSPPPRHYAHGRCWCGQRHDQQPTAQTGT